MVSPPPSHLQCTCFSAAHATVPFPSLQPSLTVLLTPTMLTTWLTVLTTQTFMTKENRSSAVLKPCGKALLVIPSQHGQSCVKIPCLPCACGWLQALL
jgi:hypothetical protein